MAETELIQSVNEFTVMNYFENSGFNLNDYKKVLHFSKGTQGREIFIGSCP